MSGYRFGNARCWDLHVRLIFFIAPSIAPNAILLENGLMHGYSTIHPLKHMFFKLRGLCTSREPLEFDCRRIRAAFPLSVQTRKLSGSRYWLSLGPEWGCRSAAWDVKARLLRSQSVIISKIPMTGASGEMPNNPVVVCVPRRS